jgi:hypothetical protein
VTVKAGGLFRGTLRAPRMVVEDGATLDADVAVGTAEAVPATAVAVNATDEGERHD